MKKKPQIVLVDDHQLFRKGIKSIITDRNLGDVIGEASDGEEFIELLSHLKPDLVLMDIIMPKMNGMEATYKALQLMPQLKIIVYTMFGEGEYYYRMSAIGVKGFIVKDGRIEELEKAINEVMMGKTYFSPGFQITNESSNQNTMDPDANWGSATGEHIES
jgi:DNA-binding NarL/FixJ family response regulator